MIREYQDEITINNIEDRTIFAVETDNDEKLVHILGYIYDGGDGTETPYRHLQYMFFYVPLEEVVRNGLYAVEIDEQENYDQDIQDISIEDALRVYHSYYNGTTPISITEADITLDMPDGCYIL